MRLLISALLAFSLMSPLGAVDQLPSLGDSSQEGLTLAQEREIGEAAMREIRRSGEMAEDPEIVAYLNRLGSRLVEASGHSEMSFTFFPMLDHSVNAFAIPGGYIGIHTGLIVMSQHESELASVMAHEIAHVSQHHIARLIEGTRSNPLVTLASIGVAILAAQSGSGDAAMGALMVGSGYNLQKQLDYTYAHEQEADRLGMQTLSKSGLDPSAMPTFFERLQKHNRIVEANAPEFLRTHPVTYKRIADAQARLNEVPYRQTPDSADYLFVREKSRALQMKPADAVVFYRKTIADKRYANEAAQQYGLANALYLAGDYPAAWTALQSARKTFGKESHPSLEFLSGSILLAQEKNTEAIATFNQATKLFPVNRALAYGLIDALIAAGQYEQALATVQDYQSLYLSDAWFYQRAARIYNKQGKAMQAHKAQAEYYVRLQENAAAIEQLQIALRQPGSDFYVLSSIEARLRELKGNVSPREDRTKPQQ